ncbi:MAG: hypothetical protein HY556_09440 [Euryarchaeota archaeon]|nr:hypothetical protein [Euryarchaeota archaeon]
MDEAPPPIRVPPSDLTSDEERFLARLAPLFSKEQEKVRPAYDSLIYAFQRPITLDYASKVFRFAGVEADRKSGPAPWSQSFTSAIFPETRQLLELSKVPGATLPAAAALMHFCTPSYPAYLEGSVEGLRRLGRKVDRVDSLDPTGLTAYDSYVRELQRLKDAATFMQVPETYYFLTRIMEAALAAYSRE